MIDKDFEKYMEIKLVNNQEIPPIKMEYLDKRSIEYDRYYWDDFYIMIKKHYDFEHSGLYQLIYEDAYGEWNGTLLTKEEIKNKYNLIIE